MRDHGDYDDDAGADVLVTGSSNGSPLPQTVVGLPELDIVVDGVCSTRCQRILGIWFGGSGPAQYRLSGRYAEVVTNNGQQVLLVR
jgi:hypothetical protein